MLLDFRQAGVLIVVFEGRAERKRVTLVGGVVARRGHVRLVAKLLGRGVGQKRAQVGVRVLIKLKCRVVEEIFVGGKVGVVRLPW